MLRDISLKKIEEISIVAGKRILQIYNEEFSVKLKSNKTPVTKADLIANDIICTQLQKSYPNIPIISEENKSVPYIKRKNWDIFWCVDPLDGTKEFIKKNGEFTVNIALIYKNEPVLGVIYVPVSKDLYSAKKGKGAYKNSQKLPLHVKPENHNIKAITSRSHKNFIDEKNLEKMLDNGKYTWIYKGSSIKLCMVAEGSVDVYPRFVPSYEWDIAAGDAIVRECGKKVYDWETKKSLLYNKKSLKNGFIVVR